MNFNSVHCCYSTVLLVKLYMTETVVNTTTYKKRSRETSVFTTQSGHKERKKERKHYGSDYVPVHPKYIKLDRLKKS